MEINDIVALLEIFKRMYCNLDYEEKAKRLGVLFGGINFCSSEINYSNQKLAKIIEVRMEQQEVCPKCEGFGCDVCRNTGKNNIY